MSKVVIGGLQLAISPAGDNLGQVSQAVRHTLSLFPWVHMVLLSELAVHGASPAHAEPLPGASERALQALAQEHRRPRCQRHPPSGRGPGIDPRRNRSRARPRTRRAGILGLGQPLKSFRDAPAHFSVYDVDSPLRASLASLGPVAKPDRRRKSL